MTIFFLYLFFIFCVACGATWVVRWYALRKKFFDIPNDRSSHAHPTPRGGGIAIAFAVFCAVGFLYFFTLVPANFVWAFIGGGLMIVAVSFVDDRYHLDPRYRVLVHAIAAAWVLYFLGGFSSLDIGLIKVPFGWLGTVLAFFGLIWMSNLYNFMDGIDGLAASEAVFIGGVGGLFLASASAGGLAFVSFAIAASAAGFLVWNWHPAKIFMGDVGSVLLGFSFGVLALFGERIHDVPALAWVLLLTPFIVDATASTVRRMVKRERWFEAHRTFAYQKAVEKGSTHSRVTLRTMAFNSIVFFLLLLVVGEPRLLVPTLVLSFAFFLYHWRKTQYAT